jgi:hypothetical protein
MSPHFHTRFPKPSVIDRVSPRKPKAEAVREVGGLRRTRGKRAACDMTVDDARWTARDGGGRMITHTHGPVCGTRGVVDCRGVVKRFS